MLDTVNKWVLSARKLLSKSNHIPLINDESIEMEDALEDAWMCGGHTLCTAVENALARDPNDLAVRFVALNVVYRLSTRDVREVEDDDEQRHKLLGQLRYLVRLRDESDCNDLITIRWEIVNACAVSEFDRALRMCERLNGQLPPQQVQVLLGRLHFLIGIAHTSDSGKSIEHWNLPLGPQEDGMLGHWRGLNTQLLYTAGIQGSPARAALTEDDTDNLRDAIKHLERALTISQAVPPSTRLLLARAYASIGDAHNAARHYRWMRDNLAEFLKSCAEETGLLWNTEFGNALLIGIHECLVNAYDHAEELDNAISAANDWIASCPKHPGTFDRMARLFQKRGDFAEAYKWLRKEADRNPSFGEDPNISIALALGGVPAGFQLDKLLKDLATSRPHEYSLVESVVQTHWASFAKLQPDSRERWATGAWLLGADMPLPPGVAAHCFAWVVERELRSAVFAPFVKHAKGLPGLLESNADERTKVLSRYLKGHGNITLGQMFTTLEGAPHWQSSLATQLVQRLKSRHPQLLSGSHHHHTDRIIALRNREDHGDMRAITTAEAQEMATLCQGLISALHPTP